MVPFFLLLSLLSSASAATFTLSTTGLTMAYSDAIPATPVIAVKTRDRSFLPLDNRGLFEVQFVDGAGIVPVTSFDYTRVALTSPDPATVICTWTNSSISSLDGTEVSLTYTAVSNAIEIVLAATSSTGALGIYQYTVFLPLDQAPTDTSE